MFISTFFILGVFLLTLQTSLFQSFPDWFGRPDLLFVLFIFLATRSHTYQGAVLALLFGTLMDIFSGVYLGIYPLLYLALYVTLKTLSRHFMLNDQTYQAPLVAVSYLIFNIGIVVFSIILATGNELMWAWGQRFPFIDRYSNRVPAQPSSSLCSLVRSRRTLSMVAAI